MEAQENADAWEVEVQNKISGSNHQIIITKNNSNKIIFLFFFILKREKDNFI